MIGTWIIAVLGYGTSFIGIVCAGWWIAEFARLRRYGGPEEKRNEAAGFAIFGLLLGFVMAAVTRWLLGGA